ncbi:MAG: cobalamin biosynthesis protein CbiD [Lachnospiraceae bacterium]|nr:cobalamin biosynthesis protein CbiD [Lachnospiraceae bacterium]
MRNGFTTGSCAAAASKAALLMLLTKSDIFHVTIQTPKGIPYNTEIVDISRDEEAGTVSCAVVKDGGDDPDVTTGARIFASVTLTNDGMVRIDGGEGIGRVTKPGLDQPQGNAAINSVPRKMIEENVREVLREQGLEDRGASVVISCPEGETLAEKTFNPRLGIVGGISILGTTGIVEPMSDKAIVETIRTEARVRKAEGYKILLAAPGNYGLTFLKEVYGTPEETAIMSSNFICDTVGIAVEEGFSKLLFVGHIGKLVKVAGGIKNTHSMYGDHRMEILCSLLKKIRKRDGLPEDPELEERIMECVTTDEAIRIIREVGLAKEVCDEMTSSIKANLEAWSEGNLEAEVIVFAGENTELATTARAHAWIKNLM